MEKNKYYDGSKLLNMLDSNGKKPIFYMVTSNRTAGKTTFWHRYLMNRYLKHGEKFGLIFRYKEMLSDIDGKFFKEIGRLFFSDYICKAVKNSEGTYSEIYICEKGKEEDKDAWNSCGYALALNSAGKYKNYSHYFADIKTLFFDEFQAEFGEYCPKEINKFMNLYTSVARGEGEQVRYLPIIMASNTVSLINPYFTFFHITNKIQSNTKFLRGDKYVLECNFNQSAANAVNGIFSGFGDESYNRYQSDGLYCLDNMNFLEKKEGKNRYLFTIDLHGKSFGVRLYDDGIVYINKKADLTNINHFSGDIESHSLGTILTASGVWKKQLTEYFNRGKLRFYDLETKEYIIEFLTSGYH